MLKEFRKSKNITQEKIAELANIDIRSYQEIEAERTIPLINTFAKIVLALEIDKDEIVKLLEHYAKMNNKKGKKGVE